MYPTYRSIKQNKIQELMQDPVMYSLVSHCIGFMYNMPLHEYMVMKRKVETRLKIMGDRDLDILILYFKYNYSNYEISHKLRRLDGKFGSLEVETVKRIAKNAIEFATYI